MRFEIKMTGKTTRNRKISLVALLATVFVVLISNMMISENVNHHCHGEADCPICSLILQCEKNINTVGSGLIMVAVAAMVFFMAAVTVSNYKYQSVQTTLVSQKVRLDS